MSDAQAFRANALKALTDQIGVYALCDLDGQPIYVGQSVDGIRARVRRHLTSARSDVIANRQLDVWEIAYVWGWAVDLPEDVAPLEAAIYAHFDAELPLMNGKSLDGTPDLWAKPWPVRQEVQVIAEEERLRRLNPAQRLPRQIQQYNLLVDYILTVKNAPHLKRSLDAHFARLVRFHQTFL